MGEGACDNCGAAAGEACSRCGKPFCSKHGTECDDCGEPRCTECLRIFEENDAVCVGC